LIFVPISHLFYIHQNITFKIVFKIAPAQAKILKVLVQDQTLEILEDENENGIVEVIFN